MMPNYRASHYVLNYVIKSVLIIINVLIVLLLVANNHLATFFIFLYFVLHPLNFVVCSFFGHLSFYSYITFFYHLFYFISLPIIFYPVIHPFPIFFISAIIHEIGVQAAMPTIFRRCHHYQTRLAYYLQLKACR